MIGAASTKARTLSPREKSKMAIKNVELIHECAPQHMSMGRATKTQRREGRQRRERTRNEVQWVRNKEIPTV